MLNKSLTHKKRGLEIHLT